MPHILAPLTKSWRALPSAAGKPLEPEPGTGNFRSLPGVETGVAAKLSPLVRPRNTPTRRGRGTHLAVRGRTRSHILRATHAEGSRLDHGGFTFIARVRP